MATFPEAWANWRDEEKPRREALVNSGEDVTNDPAFRELVRQSNLGMFNGDPSDWFLNPVPFLMSKGFVEAERATPQQVADALAGKGQVYDISDGTDSGQGIFYDPNAPRVATPTIQDQMLRFQFEHTQKFGQSIDRPWTDDADARRAGQTVIDRYRAAGGTENYTVETLPVTQSAAGRRAEHRSPNMPTGARVLGAAMTAGGLMGGSSLLGGLSGLDAVAGVDPWAAQGALEAFGSTVTPAAEALTTGATTAGTGLINTGATTLPDNYGNMLADAGGNVSDAGPINAGTIGTTAGTAVTGANAADLASTLTGGTAGADTAAELAGLGATTADIGLPTGYSTGVTAGLTGATTGTNFLNVGEGNELANTLTPANWAGANAAATSTPSAWDWLTPITDWAKANPLLSSTALSVGGGLIKGAFTPSPEDQAKAIMDAKVEAELRLQAERRANNNLRGINVDRMRGSRRRLALPGIINFQPRRA